MKSIQTFLFLICLFHLSHPANGAYLSLAGKGQTQIWNGVNMESGCVMGSGKPATTKRTLSFFDSLHIEGSVDVFVTSNQKEQKLEVAGDHNLHSFVVTEVREKTLYISGKSGSICPQAGLRVNILVDDLKSVFARGASVLSIEKLRNSGLSVEVEDSADLKVMGESENLTVKARGATDVNLRFLKAANVNISIKGSSDAVVFASQTLHAKISDAANLIYYGSPENITHDISGAGDLEKGED